MFVDDIRRQRVSAMGGRHWRWENVEHEPARPEICGNSRRLVALPHYVRCGSYRGAERGVPITCTDISVTRADLPSIGVFSNGSSCMNLARYALAPWWVFQLFTGAKAFSRNPVLGSRRLNAKGLHVARIKAADAMASRRRRRLAGLISAEDRATFDRDGYVERRDFLPTSVFERLRNAALDFRGPAREMWQGDTLTRRFALDQEALAAIPEARELLADPVWRGLLRYVGSHDAEPLVYIQSILSHVADAPPDPQTTLHADTFHATVKAWLFLTDVAEDEGPLCYVPGSHRSTPERIEWERARSLVLGSQPDSLSSRGSLRIQADELAALQLPQPRALAVPANTLVVADTHGFHARGLSVRPTIRIEIWAYGRSNPFLPWTGLDPSRLPGIAERRIGWMWRTRDRFEGMVGQPWRDAGRKRPADPA